MRRVLRIMQHALVRGHEIRVPLVVPAGVQVPVVLGERRRLHGDPDPVTGLENAADYENLPLVHNGFSTRYVNQALPGAFFFLGALFIYRPKKRSGSQVMTLGNSTKMARPMSWRTTNGMMPR